VHSVAPFEVGFVVRDIDALLPFYTRVLGMSVFSDIEMPSRVTRPTGLSPSGYRVVRLETNLGQRFKLARAGEAPEVRVPSSFALQRAGNAYVTFLVDDIHAVHERLQAHGAGIRSDGVVEVRPGVLLMLASDPEGNWLEFVQYADLRSYFPGR
jgi:catechol 2,3-dioxygenase-like lactoylglutathione lyase family enzyme